MITQSHLPGQPESSWPFSTCVSTSALVSISMGTSVYLCYCVFSLSLSLSFSLHPPPPLCFFSGLLWS